MQLGLTIGLFAVAAFIAIGNLAGVSSHAWRRRRGETAGFSTVPLLSVLLCTAAFLVGPQPLGPWVWVPALVDPATWSLICLPFFLLRRHDLDDRDADQARGKGDGRSDAG